MRRFLFVFFIALLFPVMSLFAGGANEGRVYYFPRNVVNNQSVMIELTQAKSLSTTTLAADYVNNSTDNLAIFRLRDSLNSSYNSGSGVIVTISSESDWYFVHENNPTSKRSFQLQAFCVDRASTDYSADSFQALSSSTTLGESGASTYFKYENGVYTMLLPYTSFSWKFNLKVGLAYLAAYIREFDVCVVIPDDNTNLESGYYTTTLTISSTTYQETNSNGNADGNAKTMTETITLRGYVGVDPGESGGVYSFSIGSLADTYSMDLGITTQSTPYAVASASFLYNELVTSITSNAASRFTIYISPTNKYSDAGTYKFIKIGSENQARTDANTIYYDLYLGTGSGYKSIGSAGSYTLNEGTIGSAGKLSDSVSTTYYIRPKYSYQQTSSTGILGSNSNEYMEKWELDQPIYLMLTTESLAATHNPGMYYSNVYFTLVYK